jgi:hypothetical protein
VKSQLVPLQVGVAPNGAVHAAHELPQLLTLLFGTQAPPHWCVPGPQAMPQTALFTHVAVPPAGAGQALHELPQLLGLSLATQVPPHR